jgi:hypothetical protein
MIVADLFPTSHFPLPISDPARALINLVMGEVGIVILVAGGVSLYVLWYLRGRDRPVGLIAEYLREPPSDLHPGVVGTLIDEHANYHDIVATLVNLGRRGVLHIRPIATPQGQIRDYLIESARRDLPLSRVETLLRDLLFGPNDNPQRHQVILSTLRPDFDKAVPQFKLALYEEVVAHGFFLASPRAVRDRYWTIGCSVIIAAGGLALATSFLIPGFHLVLFPVIALAIIGIATYKLARAMPVKTLRGAEEAAKWLAFRRYLADIRRYERDVTAVKGIFERYLPYATAFGLEQHWVQTFKRANPPAPAWYNPADVIITNTPGPHHHPTFSGSGPNLPDLGNLASAIPTDLPNLSGAGDVMGSLLDAASSGGGAGLDAVSDGLSGLLDAASSLFDW